jgi:hypothetical protein
MLVMVLFRCLVGQRIQRPYLAVGMGIGEAHHGALVLKELHPAIAPAQLDHLLGPHVDDTADGSQIHFGQGQVVAR